MAPSSAALQPRGSFGITRGAHKNSLWSPLIPACFIPQLTARLMSRRPQLELVSLQASARQFRPKHAFCASLRVLIPYFRSVRYCFACCVRCRRLKGAVPAIDKAMEPGYMIALGSVVL